MRYSTLNFEYGISAPSDGDSAQPPILFLHGFTGSRRSWDAVRDALDYPTAAIDLPGHGETRIIDPNKPVSFEVLISDLLQILDHLNYKKIHLCGYSFGGRIALAFAMTHPERLSSLILESASPGLAEAQSRQERMAKDRELADKFVADFKNSIAQWSRLPFFRCQQQRNPSEWQKQQETRQQAHPAGLAYALEYFGTGAQPSYWENLNRLSLPVLLISGDEDAKFKGIAREMCQRLTHCESAAIQQAGHTTHLDQSEKFISVLKYWIEDKYRSFSVKS